MTRLPGSSAWLRTCRGIEMLRLEMLLWSGMLMVDFMRRVSEFMKPSVWRSGRWKT